MTNSNANNAAVSRSAEESAALVRRILEPKSIAIIGMSARPGSPGQNAIQNFESKGYSAELHLVGRQAGEIDGRPVLGSIDDLPEGIDLAIFMIPSAGIPDAIAACIRRKVGGGVVFASGFAETGGEGELAEQRITEMVQESGFGLVGPNCLGLFNFLNGLTVFLFRAPPFELIKPEKGKGLAVVGQSGGLVNQLRSILTERGLPVAYNTTTGNEAGLDLCDFLHFFIQDEAVGTIAAYTEQIQRPAAFLEAVAAARAAGKTIVVMHPGRSAKGKEAFQSHTGSLAGDYDTMRTVAEAAGVLMVDTLEEWADVTEMLARYPNPSSKGAGLVTFSGALCGIAHDLAEDMEIEYPEPHPETLKKINDRLPDFVNAKNPVDMTTQPAFETELLGYGVRALLDDDKLGSVAISIPFALLGDKYMDGLIPLIDGNDKLLAASPMNDGRPLADDLSQRMRDANIVLHYSTERMLRAIARVTQYAKKLEQTGTRAAAKEITGLPDMNSGAQAEWRGKEILSAMGISVPKGGLAISADEAALRANDIGYPVVMKAQSKDLAHKTEAGGVMVGIADEDELRTAYDKLLANIEAYSPGLKLDGVLVEAMSGGATELVIGAKRDPHWGPVLLVGLGGIWVEALGDVKLLPAWASEDWIKEELLSLKTAKLLTGFRGKPPADIDAVTRTAALIGRLMMTRPDITEIDINPLIVHAEGDGVTALDALIVTEDA